FLSAGHVKNRIGRFWGVREVKTSQDRTVARRLRWLGYWGHQWQRKGHARSQFACDCHFFARAAPLSSAKSANRTVNSPVKIGKRRNVCRQFGGLFSTIQKNYV